MISPDNSYSCIEVTGDAIYPVIQAIPADALSKSLLIKHGLDNTQKGKYYPLNKYLSLLHDIEIRIPSLLREIGAFIIQEAIFPPGIDSFERALASTDQAYHINHIGFKKDEIGHYNFKKISEVLYLMSVSCPYPCEFDQGIILGMAQKFNVSVTVGHSSDICRINGAPQCDYQISIKS